MIISIVSANVFLFITNGDVLFTSNLEYKMEVGCAPCLCSLFSNINMQIFNLKFYVLKEWIV